MDTPSPSLAIPPSWLAVIGARQAEALTRSLGDLAAAVPSGAIPNARLKEAGQLINRALERAWDAAGNRLRQPRDDEGGSPYPAAIDQMFYSRPTLATFARHEKKVAALPAHPLSEAWSQVLADALPIVRAWDLAKPLAAKRQVRTEAMRDAERFTPPPVTSRAQARVQALLEESVASSYEKLCVLLRTKRTRVLERFLDAAARARSEPCLRSRQGGYTVYWHFDRYNRQSPDRGDSASRREVESLVVPPRAGGAWTLVSDADARIDEMVRGEAERLRLAFVAKNLRKIASILEAKGDERFAGATVVDMPVDLLSFQGSIRFSFKDGASFRVDNGIVFSRSPLGTPFVRFPLTFHDVILPSGKPMPFPSEERMNTVFALENGPLPVARRRPGV